MLRFILLPLTVAALIPRDVLFSDPKYSSSSLSPDGRFHAYIAPDEKGIRQVYTKCVSCRHTRQVTFETDSVLAYEWTGVSDVMLYMQDRGGDENTMIYKKNISQDAIARDPTARSVVSETMGVKAVVIANNLKENYILVGINDETPTYHNVYKYDLLSDEMTLVLRNKRFAFLVCDNDMNIRLGVEEQQGDSVYHRRRPDMKMRQQFMSSEEAEWQEYLRVAKDDKIITTPIAFDAENRHMYWIWGEGTDLGNLVVFDFEDPSKKEVLYTATRAQIGSILFHPQDRTLLAVSEVYHRPELFVANETVMDDLQYLVNLRPHGSLQIISLSRDMNTWLVTFLSADQPFEVFVYRKWLKTAELLYNTNPELQAYKLGKQIGFTFSTRDNVLLQAYISLPAQAPLMPSTEVPLADRGYAELGMIPQMPQKMVVLVHGGPKARDHFGFSPMNAWFTDRGYAVLQVNFRGSTGFGKRLTNMGNGEWGRKMHFDLIDAVQFAIAKNIANRTEIAIVGGSYGGYAALVGLSFTPDVFACAIDIVGPSNLITLLQAVPPYWKAHYTDIVDMLGADLDTEAGRQALTARSPLFFADKVSKPIMILQGANDPRVKQAESDQFVEALQKNNIPVTYLVYPDEGHGFKKMHNRLAQYGYMEKFLHQCMGGQYEDFNVKQYNTSVIIKSDGFLIGGAPRTTLAPALFYRPIKAGMRHASRMLHVPMAQRIMT